MRKYLTLAVVAIALMGCAAPVSTPTTTTSTLTVQGFQHKVATTKLWMGSMVAVKSCGYFQGHYHT